jgi:L-type amino acid transporter 6
MHGTRGSLTYLNGLALVVSLQIGSGIFSAPSEVSKHVSSATSGVSVWLFAGLLVWTGAASFIELGRAIPRNGGVQEYLRRCYGDFYGFLFSWIWITIAKPCAMAIMGTIFADYFTSALLPDSWNSIWINKFIAIIALWLITGLNCLGKHTGAYVANGFLVLKLFGLFSIVAIGLVMGVMGKSLGDHKANQSDWLNNRHDPTKPSLRVSDTSVWQMIGQYVTALFSALFCYGGWETVSIRKSGNNFLPLDL